MTDAEVFDLYAAHGTTVADFYSYVGQSVDWLAAEIADMDPECANPTEAARQFMRYVADHLAEETHLVCRSSEGVYARHFYTDRSTPGKSEAVQTCMRCGQPRPKSTWTLKGKVKCPGGPPEFFRFEPGMPKTACCPTCGKWIAVRWSRPRGVYYMRTHYVKEAK